MSLTPPPPLPFRARLLLRRNAAPLSVDFHTATSAVPGGTTAPPLADDWPWVPGVVPSQMAWFEPKRIALIERFWAIAKEPGTNVQESPPSVERYRPRPAWLIELASPVPA